MGNNLLNDLGILLFFVFGSVFILCNDLVELQVQRQYLGDGINAAEDELIKMAMLQQGGVAR